MHLSTRSTTVLRRGARFTTFPSTRSYGRSSPYRRIHTPLKHTSSIDRYYGSPSSSSQVPFLYSSSVIPRLQPLQPNTLRLFSSKHTGQESESQGDQESHKNKESHGDKDSHGDQDSHEDGTKNQKKGEAPPPPPPHGDKSPWQVFTETLSSEFKASKEWNESTKALMSSAHQFTENESVKRAKAAYTTASDTATSRTASAFKTTGKAIGQSAAWTWDTLPVKGVRSSVNTIGRGLNQVTKPVRETEAFKSVKNVIDDGSSRYGGWIEKEERQKVRELRELGESKGGKRREEKMEDPNAGTNITLHKDAAWKESWQEFKDSSVMQSLFSLKTVYNESENPLITTARSISDRLAGFFSENEVALVIRKIKSMDANFQLEPFLRDLREYILPEVLDAYVKGDIETLRLWLSAAQFSVYSALQQQWKTAGLRVDGKILDIRGVDILSARILEPGEIPILIITCRTQEVHTYRSISTGELAAGMEDKVQLVTYAIGITRTAEDVHNPETRGWRLIELQKSNRDYI